MLQNILDEAEMHRNAPCIFFLEYKNTTWTCNNLLQDGPGLLNIMNKSLIQLQGPKVAAINH